MRGYQRRQWQSTGARFVLPMPRVLQQCKRSILTFGWLAGLLVGWLAGWLHGWLHGWLTEHSSCEVRSILPEQCIVCVCKQQTCSGLGAGSQCGVLHFSISIALSAAGGELERKRGSNEVKSKRKWAISQACNHQNAAKKECINCPGHESLGFGITGWYQLTGA